MVRSFLAPEMLNGDNQYYCEQCNAKRDATRRLSVETLPQYACFQVKRFAFDMRTFDKKKMHDNISFPKRFDPADYGMVDGYCLTDFEFVFRVV